MPAKYVCLDVRELNEGGVKDKGTDDFVEPKNHRIC